MPIADSAIEEARREVAEAEMAPPEPQDDERREDRAATERRDFRPAPPAAIADAIVEVTHIIGTLKRVLDEMEEVLETLELAEVQKNADEREIQSLRNALRQLDRRGPELRREQQGERGPQPHGREPRRHGRR